MADLSLGWVMYWFIFNGAIVAYDCFFVLLRPMTLPGGSLAKLSTYCEPTHCRNPASTLCFRIIIFIPPGSRVPRGWDRLPCKLATLIAPRPISRHTASSLADLAYIKVDISYGDIQNGMVWCQSWCVGCIRRCGIRRL